MRSSADCLRLVRTDGHPLCWKKGRLTICNFSLGENALFRAVVGGGAGTPPPVFRKVIHFRLLLAFMWMPCRCVPCFFFQWYCPCVLHLDFLGAFCDGRTFSNKCFKLRFMAFFPVSVAVQSCYSCCFPFFLRRMIFRFHQTVFVRLRFSRKCAHVCVDVPHNLAFVG